MNLLQKVSFQTPAKINFFLFIQKKRTDGYHELLMDMVPVSLFDQIELVPNQNQGIRLHSNLKDLPQEDNIICKALDLLENTCHQQFSLDIKLTKHIPTGAGLGGGSGNAAGILVVLNHLFRLDLSDEILRELALTLGADVPFFIDPKPVRVKGIGEILIPIDPFNPLPILLAYPNFPISTAQAYGGCQISKRNSGYWNYLLSHKEPRHCELNDFWKHLSHEFPKLDSSISRLNDSGALLAGMSGSGSTLYGVYSSTKARDSAYENLMKTEDLLLFPVKTINNHSYL